MRGVGCGGRVAWPGVGWVVCGWGRSTGGGRRGAGLLLTAPAAAVHLHTHRTCCLVDAVALASACNSSCRRGCCTRPGVDCPPTAPCCWGTVSLQRDACSSLEGWQAASGVPPSTPIDTPSASSLPPPPSLVVVVENHRRSPRTWELPQPDIQPTSGRGGLNVHHPPHWPLQCSAFFFSAPPEPTRSSRPPAPSSRPPRHRKAPPPPPPGFASASRPPFSAL